MPVAVLKFYVDKVLGHAVEFCNLFAISLILMLIFSDDIFEKISVLLCTMYSMDMANILAEKLNMAGHVPCVAELCLSPKFVYFVGYSRSH